jgi:hypothetical protein
MACSRVNFTFTFTLLIVYIYDIYTIIYMCVYVCVCLSYLSLVSDIYQDVFVTKAGTVYCCVGNEFVNIWLCWFHIKSIVLK